MNRVLFPLLLLAVLIPGIGSAAPSAERAGPGIWRVRIGQPEPITPVSTRHHAPRHAALEQIGAMGECPVQITGSIGPRGVLLSIPLQPDEQIYGLGLQLQSFQQRATKKTLRVNADPEIDTGDTHAPVPFYVTTRGYGVFVDTARYATFYLGNKVRAPGAPRGDIVPGASNDGWNGVPPYEQKGLGRSSEVLVEVPRAGGVDVYVFAGPSMREAVQRYNLFSGGGAMPPRWGLGFWYRAKTDYSQEDVERLAGEFRERRIPCDVLGLEPRWQSHVYSSSYVWSKGFPDPKGLLDTLTRQHFRLNLWEQAFVHPTSPIYGDLLRYSGDFEVWGGLVPDFLTPQARSIFAAHHERAHVDLGVSGYKADECDNSDFTGNWSFPEISRFPSGADGEQMHMLFGLRYQDAIQSIFERRQQRTYGLVRSSGALAAPYPYVLYSDLYDHRQFVHGIAQSSFSGLLWTPEVRDSSGGPAELVRRLQAVAFSPLAMVNAWYLKNPPWKQVNRAANNADRLAEGWEKTEALCRSVVELRMQFIPYLHAAFARYHREGIPPFRAMVLDFPNDPAAAPISDQYLMGDSLLVAPIIVPTSPRNRPPDSPPTVGEQSSRSVYLPAGEWYDFWTGEKLNGGRRLEVNVPLDRIPLYVKAGSILPLARVTAHTEDPACYELTAHVYGDGRLGGVVCDDDGGYSPLLTDVRITWDPAAEKASLRPTAPTRYSIKATVVHR